MKTYCIFSAQYLPHMGGVENFTYHLARQLVSRGNKVIIVTSNTEVLSSIEITDDIKIFRFPVFNLLNGRYPVIKKNKEFKRIYNELNKEEIDVVIVNTRFYIHSLLGVRFASKKNIRHFVIEHGSTHLSVNNALLDKVGAIFEHRLTYFVKRQCHEFYGVSNACNEWLAHFGIKSNGVIHNAIDIDEAKKIIANNKKSYREQLNIPKDALVVAFTGRLTPEKGIPNLLKAFKKLDNKNLYLIVAGDGPLLELVQQSNERIIALGRINMDNIYSLLLDADIFCLPSFSEGFSTSILEAAVCKSYIVTTKQGGATELLLDDSYGVVIEDYSIHNIVDGLNKAIDLKKAERTYAVEKTYTQLKDNFTWHETANKVEKIINLPKQ